MEIENVTIPVEALNDVPNVQLENVNTSLETIISKLTDIFDLLNSFLDKFMEYMNYIGVVSAITLFLLVALFVMLAIRKR